VKINAEKLKQDLAAIIDPIFATQLVDSYTKMQQRYYAGDWQPSELDGGQFCEAVIRALYQVDTEVVDQSHLPKDISDQLKSKTPPSPHKLDYKDRDHFLRVLQTTYKFRSDRGVAHVSATYTANHLDATLIMANVKWLFAEFLRLTWKKDRNEVVAIIEAIVQLEHPLIHELDGKPLVLSSELSAPEELLMLLQHSSGGCYTRDELKQYAHASPAAVNTALSRLSDNRQVRISEKGDVVITSLGEERVREEILPKLASKDGMKRGG
jgi:hypothetical protein